MSTPTPAAIETLRAAVQTNCDISDARHAGDFSLCIYLLKMREYYRWERGLPLDREMPQSDVGEWLRRREAHWDTLAEREFVALPTDGGLVPPFEAARVNAELAPLGFVYSAGLGRGARPHFVLARLAGHERCGDFQVYRCAHELARDLSAPPAMTQGDTIYLRLESIRRMIWEKVQESDWHTEDAPSHRLMRHYGYARDAEAAMDRMSEELCHTVLDHEIGEFLAGDELGTGWEDMLMAFAGTRAEIMLRAIRDLFADSLVTLPNLVQTGHVGALHYYAGNMTGMRQHLFPSFQSAYRGVAVATALASLARLAPRARDHWRRVCVESLALFRERGEPSRPNIESLIEEQRL